MTRLYAGLDDLDVPGYDEELLKTLTADLKDADELLAGYGIIDDSAKAEMKKAAERYEQKDEEYTQSAEEIKPAPAPGPAPSMDAAVEDRAQELDRRYIVCPKCGEKIWL